MTINLDCPNCHVASDYEPADGARVRLECPACHKPFDLRRIKVKSMTSRQIASSQISGYDLAIRGATADRDDDLIEFWGMTIPQAGEGDAVAISSIVDRKGNAGAVGSVTNVTLGRSWVMTRQIEKVGCSSCAGRAAMIVAVIGAASWLLS